MEGNKGGRERETEEEGKRRETKERGKEEGVRGGKPHPPTDINFLANSFVVILQRKRGREGKGREEWKAREGKGEKGEGRKGS